MEQTVRGCAVLNRGNLEADSTKRAKNWRVRALTKAVDDTFADARHLGVAFDGVASKCGVRGTLVALRHKTCKG